MVEEKNKSSKMTNNEQRIIALERENTELKVKVLHLETILNQISTMASLNGREQLNPVIEESQNKENNLPSTSALAHQQHQLNSPTNERLNATIRLKVIRVPDLPPWPQKRNSISTNGNSNDVSDYSELEPRQTKQKTNASKPAKSAATIKLSNQQSVIQQRLSRHLIIKLPNLTADDIKKFKTNLEKNKKSKSPRLTRKMGENGNGKISNSKGSMKK